MKNINHEKSHNHRLQSAVFAAAALGSVCALSMSTCAETVTYSATASVTYAGSDESTYLVVGPGNSTQDYLTAVELRTVDEMTEASDSEYEEDYAVYGSSSSRAATTANLTVYDAPTVNPSMSLGNWKQDAETGKWKYLSYYNSAPATDGWVYIGGQTSYLDRSGSWYHFDADGYMTTGWTYSGGNWYYGSDDEETIGQALTGWYTDSDDGRTYYFGVITGKMMTGWQRIDNYWYYFATADDTEGDTWAYDEAAGTWNYTGTGSRPLGSMYRGEVTPDGWGTDSNGRCLWQYSMSE